MDFLADVRRPDVRDRNVYVSIWPLMIGSTVYRRSPGRRWQKAWRAVAVGVAVGVAAVGGAVIRCSLATLFPLVSCLSCGSTGRVLNVPGPGCCQHGHRGRGAGSVGAVGWPPTIELMSVHVPCVVEKPDEVGWWGIQKKGRLAVSPTFSPGW
jgi:hypothetical protein